MSVVIIGGNECMSRKYTDICQEHGCKAKVFQRKLARWKENRFSGLDDSVHQHRFPQNDSGCNESRKEELCASCTNPQQQCNCLAESAVRTLPDLFQLSGKGRINSISSTYLNFISQKSSCRIFRQLLFPICCSIYFAASSVSDAERCILMLSISANRCKFSEMFRSSACPINLSRFRFVTSGSICRLGPPTHPPTHAIPSTKSAGNLPSFISNKAFLHSSAPLHL